MTVRHTYPDDGEAEGDVLLRVDSKSDGLRMSASFSVSVCIKSDSVPDSFLNSLLAPFVEAYVVAVRSLQALLPARPGAPPVSLSMSALVAALRQARVPCLSLSLSLSLCLSVVFADSTGRAQTQRSATAS
jgi:hypothetical protein